MRGDNTRPAGAAIVVASIYLLCGASVRADGRPQQMPSTGDHYVHARGAGQIKVGFGQVARWRFLERRHPNTRSLSTTQRRQLAGTLRAIRRTVRSAGGQIAGPPTAAKGAFIIRFTPGRGVRSGEIDPRAQQILDALTREELYHPSRARIVNYRNTRFFAQGVVNIGVSALLGLALGPACKPLGKLAGKAVKKAGSKTATKVIRQGVEVVAPRLGSKLSTMTLPSIAPHDRRPGDNTTMIYALEIASWIP